MCNAVTRLPIPFPHRIYRFRYLGTAILIDAARIDPYPLRLLVFRMLILTQLRRKSAETSDFLVTRTFPVPSLMYVFITGFVGAPAMRSYHVGWGVILVKISELERVDVEQAHWIRKLASDAVLVRYVSAEGERASTPLRDIR